MVHCIDTYLGHGKNVALYPVQHLFDRIAEKRRRQTRPGRVTDYKQTHIQPFGMLNNDLVGLTLLDVNFFALNAGIPD